MLQVIKYLTAQIPNGICCQTIGTKGHCPLECTADQDGEHQQQCQML